MAIIKNDLHFIGNSKRITRFIVYAHLSGQHLAAIIEYMNNELPLNLNEKHLRNATSTFRTINHPLRQNMIWLLHQQGPMVVNDIYAQSGICQPVASRHLTILLKAKIVTTQREGPHIYYSLNNERIKEIHLCSEQLVS